MRASWSSAWRAPANRACCCSDEPAAGLSLAERHRLLALLRALPRSLSLVLIEHDMDVAMQAADRVTVLHNGRQMADGTPDEIASNREVQAIYLGSHAA